ncbi:MAG: 3-deoxy-manno-octulosonate cytidylyltransferase [Nitrospirota bacterium]|nr:3-deoxy-manno-octulosonate cytidylyltransferase [Nitrospirota bacterium]
MSAVVIIPARYGSTRFPGKLLSPLSGKPVIRHVCERAMTATLADRVIVATDSDKIYQTVRSFGGDAVMTSSEHPSGTDRIAEAARGADYDIIVNVQGDEPLIRGEMIDSVISLLEDSRADMGTLVKRIEDTDEVFDPNVVKAVFDTQGFALYFSRAPIPFYREELRVAGCGLRVKEKETLNLEPGTLNLEFYKHIGIYSYRRDVLLNLTGLSQSALEKAERLEQLRALENGYKIKVGITAHETIGVDTREDIEKVERWLGERGK